MTVITTSPKHQVCYEGITTHITGAYCVTGCSGKEWDGVSTTLCVVPKIVMCLPCHIGALINSSLNMCCNHNQPNKNYLC